jgi:hypothetical protein
MRPYDNKKPIISIHIPKCAGTSFRNVLSSWFGEKLKYNYFNEKEKKPPTRHSIMGEDGRGVCIHGHFNKDRSFGIHDYYPEVNQFVTMLREPFEVFVSRYFYIRHLTSLNQSFRNGKVYQIGEFDEFIKNEKSSILLHMPVDMTLTNYKEIIEKYFVYIGIVEDLQTSIHRLADKLGYRTVIMEHLNKTERVQDIPDHYREFFMQRHPVEYALYEHVLATYKQ